MASRFWSRDSALFWILSLCCVSQLADRVTAEICRNGNDRHSLGVGDATLPLKALDQLALQRFQSQQSPISDEGLHSLGENELRDVNTRSSSYTALLNALEVMESHFFEVSHGTWPQAIDWTAAVMGTQVSATLSAMTEYPGLSFSSPPPSLVEARDHENLINRYFTQITSFYFGENAFSLRTQAYDDMLWVVLGWLEAIKFINLHSSLHYTSTPPSTHTHHKSNHSWYAGQFIPQYAHRARLFYDLASRGWDTTLCSGGMIWTPYLTPYKNAITNQLFIAASISMYLYFPGDNNPSPFSHPPSQSTEKLPPARAHDVQYLDNAVEAYKWLKGSGMRNEQGLYVDGFHIKGWRGGKDASNGTRQCDLRDDKVYTYNQGVLLSGLKGLYEATASIEYLQDGHELVRNVIAATGWGERNTERRFRWKGLGRGGVLEEGCDWSGRCSQNAQAFKGIFFHHLTVFCGPLAERRELDTERDWRSDGDARQLHRKSCDEYGDWIRHNAFAAYVTRDQDGVFGEWWGRPSRRRKDGNSSDDDDNETKSMERPSHEGTDYRNDGVPRDEIWRLPRDDVMYRPDEMGREGGRHRWREANVEGGVGGRDVNDRGRGRTVETQSGGVAVMRAAWRVVEGRGDGEGG